MDKNRDVSSSKKNDGEGMKGEKDGLLEGSTRTGCYPMPHRYLVTFMLCLAITVCVALRSAFALIMTHVTALNQSEPSNLIFSHCPAFNTTLDVRVDVRGEVMLMTHTAIYVGLAATVLPAGIASTIISTKLVAGVGVLMTSILSLFYPLVILRSVPVTFLFRILQGAFDSCLQNAAYSLLSAWSTAVDKGTLLSIMTAGFYIAPALSSVLTAITVCFIRWDAVFYILGGASLLWTFVWFRYFYDTPDLHPNLTPEERYHFRKHGGQIQQSSIRVFKNAPWRGIFTSRGVWGLVTAASARIAAYTILTLEQSQYFQDSFHVKIEDTGILLLLPYLLLVVFSVLGGLVSDKLITLGVSTTVTRKIVFLTGYLCEGLCMVSLYFIGDWQSAYISLSVAAAMEGFGNVGHSPLMSDMSPQYTSLIFGLCSGIGMGVVGVFTTSFISFIAGRHRNLKSWQVIYLVMAVLHFAACAVFFFLADATRQPWAEGTQLEMKKREADGTDCGSCEMVDSPTTR